VNTEAAIAAPKGLARWLGPIGRRRWAVFRAHRRGYLSLWLFLALYTLSLGAELIPYGAYEPKLGDERPVRISVEDRPGPARSS